MAERKEREQQLRRDYILRAARRVIAARGVESTRLDDVARAAQYTRRTLYAYFSNRDELLLTLYAEDLSARCGEQERAMAPCRSGLEQLLAWGRAFFRHMQREPHQLELQRYWDLHGITPETVGADAVAHFVQVNEGVAETLRRAVIGGKSDGSISAELDPEHCISQFLYCLRAVVGRAMDSSLSAFAIVDTEGYVEEFLELFARGIAPRQP